MWSSIPPAVDILVTHTPPHLHCDASASRGASLGCEDLRRALGLIRPRLHVCGHIHEARGAERIRWPATDDRTAEPYVEQWQNPNPGPENNKISLVDLSARHRKKHPEEKSACLTAARWQNARARREGPPVIDSGHNTCANNPSDISTAPQCKDSTSIGSYELEAPSLHHSGENFPSLGTLRENDAALPDQTPDSPGVSLQETCVVNCSILASNWPHAGGKRLNKPIVVDLDLPVWDAEVAVTTGYPKP